MGYYTGGDYYRAGDYYAAGGIFDVIKSVGGTIGRIAQGTGIPGISQAGGALSGLTSGGRTPQTLPPPPGGRGGFSGFQLGPLKIGSQRPPQTVEEALMQGARPRKRARMNYGNTKALRRADRRINGFVKVARGALRHTNYKIVTKSAGSRSGSRGVITRAEASRALRS